MVSIRYLGVEEKIHDAICQLKSNVYPHLGILSFSGPSMLLLVMMVVVVVAVSGRGPVERVCL